MRKPGEWVLFKYLYHADDFNINIISVSHKSRKLCTFNVMSPNCRFVVTIESRSKLTIYFLILIEDICGCWKMYDLLEFDMCNVL
jgi:hypothetical protein